jgi:hypothetical protein
VGKRAKLDRKTLTQKAILDCAMKILLWDYTDMGGWLVGDEEYGVGHIVSPNCQQRPCFRDTIQMLWLERMLSRNSAGIPFWEVVDTIDLPNRFVI